MEAEVGKRASSIATYPVMYQGFPRVLQLLNKPARKMYITSSCHFSINDLNNFIFQGVKGLIENIQKTEAEKAHLLVHCFPKNRHSSAGSSWRPMLFLGKSIIPPWEKGNLCPWQIRNMNIYYKRRAEGTDGQDWKGQLKLDDNTEPTNQVLSSPHQYLKPYRNKTGV